MFHFQCNPGCMCSYKIPQCYCRKHWHHSYGHWWYTRLYLKGKQKKEKQKAPFLKAASERKDKLTYDHVVLFRLCLPMQDFATYNRYLKELLTKKNQSHFFSLTYQTEGNAFWSHAVIAGSLDLFKKSITCAYLAPRLQVLILLQHGPCERLSTIT